MEKRKITTSIFSFEDIRKRNLFYVDKTKYFYDLVTGGDTCFFCSRPRRFGKSLALSIFHAIFTGHKELFEGLYIYGQDYDWQTYPVIHIDMARCDCTSTESLSDALMVKLAAIAKEYEVEIDRNARTPGNYFDALISALKEKTGKKVVILIDEYDKPLTENLDDIAKVESIRKLLDSFYQIIKGQNANERFVFMTGVTKFNKVSIFSKLNNLSDITLNLDYACMFGYTQKELEENFEPYINDHIAKEAEAGNKVDKMQFISEIKKWYNGFKFDCEAETVYNPVSVGQFFINHCRFSNYWFATGTPTLLVNLAKKMQLTVDDIKNAKMSEYAMNSFNIDKIATGNTTGQDLLQLLFQTGYLTINTVEQVGFTQCYILRYPNLEIEDSFERLLLDVYTGFENKDYFSYAMKNIISH